MRKRKTCRYGLFDAGLWYKGRVLEEATRAKRSFLNRGGSLSHKLASIASISIQGRCLLGWGWTDDGVS